MDLERFRRGDPACLSELVRAHQPLVQRVLRCHARDAEHARDLSQQVWYTVLRNRSSYLGIGPFEAWLCRLARGVCIRDHRRHEAAVRAEGRFALVRGEDLPQDGQPDSLAVLEREESHARLCALFGDLSRRERDALSLLVLEEKKVPEVAEIMAIRESTVRSLARHATARLRKLVGGAGE